ncbi:MAG TPA: hypothetical protein VFC39_08205 [Acidobacteriaceae bacterium]|nr:hypothetical protein [Acidobacteriaceae bacterium]
MEFRLTYQGKLPAQTSGRGGTRVPEKHNIRLQIHHQLKVLWQDHPSLRSWGNRDETERTFVDTLADNHEYAGRRFLPLVTKVGGLACSLDILFLRRDQPGGLVISGGDIDNRIKTLLDALQVPTERDQVPKEWMPSQDENPLYCLMEDDKLINSLTVATDRLLVPRRDDESKHDVVLIIHVKTIIVNNLLTFSIAGAPCV